MARLLIIDDDPKVLETLQDALSQAGYQCQCAADGNEGIQILGLGPVDLVVTDLLMPEGEGIETILRLRKSGKTMPIIAISGGAKRGGGDFLPVARMVGADETLAKPFRMADLVAAVDRLLDPARPTGPAAQST